MTRNNRSAKPKPGKTTLVRALICAMAVILFVFFFIPAAKLLDADMTSDQPAASRAVEMSSGEVFRQQIANPPTPILKSIGIAFGTYSRANHGTLKVKLYEDDAQIASWTTNLSHLKDNQRAEFELDAPYTMKPDSAYAITACALYRGNNGVAIWTDENGDQSYSVDGVPQSQGTICYTVTCAQGIARTNKIILIGAVFSVVALLMIFIIQARWDALCRLGGRIKSKCAPLLRPGLARVTVLDWIVFALLAGFCFFTMQQSDLLHTGASSFALLRGHILDFYEYNAKYLTGNSYMLTTYIVFALWNIPLAALGLMGPPSMVQSYGVMLWFKLLPTVLFALCGILFYQICKKYEDKSGVSAKWATFIFMLTPTAFYSQFMFGQYDSLTTVTMLLALKVLLDDKKHSLTWFSVLFGIATTFKYHALLFFVPILLYKEKRLPVLIKSAFFYILPIALVNLPYRHSASFSSGVEGFFALQYFFAPAINYFTEGVWKNYLVPILWVITCVYAYGTATAKDPFDQLREMAYMTGLVTWIAFGVVFWHPQWLMIATPFLALSIVVSRRRDVLCLLDIAFIFFFMCFIEAFPYWPRMTHDLFQLGIFADQLTARAAFSQIDNLSQFFPIKDCNLAFTAISCLLLARALLLRPKWAPERNLCTPVAEGIWFRLRGYVGIGILVLPMIFCLVYELSAPTFSASINVDEAKGQVRIEATSSGGFDELSAVVWSEEDGQDDIASHSFEDVGDSKWECDFSLDDHKGYGNYAVHYYCYKNQKPRLLTTAAFTLEPPAEAGD